MPEDALPLGAEARLVPGVDEPAPGHSRHDPEAGVPEDRPEREYPVHGPVARDEGGSGRAGAEATAGPRGAVEGKYLPDAGHFILNTPMAPFSGRAWRIANACGDHRRPRVCWLSILVCVSDGVFGNKKLRQISNARNLNIYTIQNNNLLQISRALKQLLNYNSSIDSIKPKERIRRVSDKLLSPLEEARLAIEEIIILKKCKIDLFPRSGAIRKLQHEIVRHYHLTSVSVGKDLDRRVRIYPNILKF